MDLNNYYSKKYLKYKKKYLHLKGNGPNDDLKKDDKLITKNKLTTFPYKSRTRWR